MILPQLSNELIESFLNGSNPMEGVRNVEVIENDVYIFQKTVEGLKIHKDTLKPFVWVRSINKDNFFTYNTTTLAHSSTSKTVTIDGVAYDKESIEFQVLDKQNNTVRYKIPTLSHWKQVVAQKAKEYGISSEKLIESYDGNACDRMANGFKFLYRIDGTKSKKHSSNPYYNRPIKGTINCLYNFFAEGGVSVYGNYHLAVNKLQASLDAMTHENKCKLFIALAPFYNKFKFFNLDKSIIESYVKSIAKHSKYRTVHINNYKEELQNVSEFDDIYEFLKKTFFKNFDIHIDIAKANHFVVNAGTFDVFENKQFKEWHNYVDALGFACIEVKEDLVYKVAAVSQYMIQSGIRLLKGVENYRDMDILTMDIETKSIYEDLDDDEFDGEKTGLDPNLASIFMIGMSISNRNFKKVINITNEQEEYDGIIEFWDLVAKEFPDVILTYNGEYFDYPFMLRRLEILHEKLKGKRRKGIDIVRDVMKPHYDALGLTNLSAGQIFNRKNAVVKVGGATEYYTQTYSFGLTYWDGLYAVKRARAQNKEIPSNKLKENIIFSELAKENRVYIDGTNIGSLFVDKHIYAKNKVNGKYRLLNKQFKFQNYENYTPKNGNTSIHLCYQTEASSLSSEQNVVLLPQPELGIDSLKIKFKKVYEQTMSLLTISNEVICDLHLFERKKAFFKKNPEIHTFYKKCMAALKERILNMQLAPDEELVTGKSLVYDYLLDDLEETIALDELRSQATFEICKWLPTNYLRVATMGGAAVWILLLSAWSYQQNIAVPLKDVQKDYGGGLLGMVDSGFIGTGMKADFASLYPSIYYEMVEVADIDITGIFKFFIKFGLDTRLYYKGLKKEAKKKGEHHLADKWDAKQLPLKILINSFYGMLGAASISPWSHIQSAHAVTAIGRQNIRHLILWLEQRGYTIVYFHTDGANFVIPETAYNYEYVGKGLNRMSPKGKQFKGVEAHIAEYNDTFMRGVMGVDIDGYFDSCINLAKGNVVFFKKGKDGKFKTSIVGGSLIRGNQNKYIKDFILEKTSLLAEENGGSKFIKAYNETVERIYKYKYSAQDICNVGKINAPLDDYVKNKLRISVHKELALIAQANGKKFSIGDLIHYVNTGDPNDPYNTSDYGSKLVFGVFVQEVPIPEKGTISEHFKFFNDAFNTGVLTSKYLQSGGGLFSQGDAFKEYMAKEKWTDYRIITRKTANKVIREVEFSKLELFVQQVDLDKELTSNQTDNKIEYNRYKYISKFNDSISQLFIVFKPETRAKLLYNPMARNKRDGTKKQVTPETLDTTLVHGVPLEGKEDKQDELEKLMYPDASELAIWKELGWHPHYPINGVKLNKNAKYEYDGHLGYKESNKGISCSELISNLSKFKIYEH